MATYNSAPLHQPSLSPNNSGLVSLLQFSNTLYTDSKGKLQAIYNARHSLIQLMKTISWCIIRPWTMHYQCCMTRKVKGDKKYGAYLLIDISNNNSFKSIVHCKKFKHFDYPNCLHYMKKKNPCIKWVGLLSTQCTCVRCNHINYTRPIPRSPLWEKATKITLAMVAGSTELNPAWLTASYKHYGISSAY